MEGFSLRFYMHSRARKNGMPLHVWLMEQARARGFAGGSTFQAIEGYGRHDTILHANRVLSWDAPVVVEFIGEDAEVSDLTRLAEACEVSLFWTKTPVSVGVSGGQSLTR